MRLALPMTIGLALVIAAAACGGKPAAPPPAPAPQPNQDSIEASRRQQAMRDSIAREQARRDSAGNYYFSGSFDGTQNFGGITLVGGWTNNNGQYSPGWPTCYLAKYAGNGSLQWVTGFGQHATRNRLTGLTLDPAGGAYAGYDSSGDGAVVAHLSDTGALDWTWIQPNTFQSDYAVKPGGATSSNCCVLTFKTQFAVMTRLDRAGNASALGQYPLQWQSLASTNGVPVIDDLSYPL